ncbi:MAG: hypothetical protein KDB32_02600 [Planctomycetes bacterium]|nr:hypothetical protein [Planctomycetota bacterium]
MVFEVEASATVGKVTRTFRAVYRRTPGAAAPAPDPNADPNAQPAEAATEEDALPPEPTMSLTLLFRDISVG